MRILHSFRWLVLLSGCAPAALAGQTAASPTTEIVVVEKDPAGRGWLATWQLDAPTRELRFERPAHGFRGRTFEVGAGVRGRK